MITEKNVVHHELIGLPAKVVESSNSLSVGISGDIVDETNHTLLIEHGSKEKRIFKKSSKIQLVLPNGKLVEVEGSLLEGRPWDRVKKKW